MDPWSAQPANPRASREGLPQAGTGQGEGSRCRGFALLLGGINLLCPSPHEILFGPQSTKAGPQKGLKSTNFKLGKNRNKLAVPESEGHLGNFPGKAPEKPPAEGI